MRRRSWPAAASFALRPLCAFANIVILADTPLTRLQHPCPSSRPDAFHVYHVKISRRFATGLKQSDERRTVTATQIYYLELECLR
jgi:hypothetical protein